MAELVTEVVKVSFYRAGWSLYCFLTTITFNFMGFSGGGDIMLVQVVVDRASGHFILFCYLGYRNFVMIHSSDVCFVSFV